MQARDQVEQVPPSGAPSLRKGSSSDNRPQSAPRMTLIKTSQLSTSLLSAGGSAPHPEPFVDSIDITAAVKGTIRVLVVDDDRTLREGCASVLTAEGYNVTAC